MKTDIQAKTPEELEEAIIYVLATGATKVNGQILDHYTASMMAKVFGRLNDQIKGRLLTLGTKNITRMAEIMWEVAK